MQALLDDQENAFTKLKKVKVGALFMDPGTGKTRTALELAKSTSCELVLFLVPFQTKDNLKIELDKWQFKMNYEIFGIESLSSSDRLYIELTNKVKAAKSVFLIVDESIKIKNRKAIRTKRLLMISSYCEFKLILNGEPLTKNLLDLWSQMELLSPKILNMTYNEFKDTFCEYVKYHAASSGRGKGRWQEFIKKYANVDYLYSLIEPYIFDASLQLNKSKQYIDVPFSVDDGLDEYINLKETFIKSFSYDPDSFLKYSTLMQQAYCAEGSKLKAIDKIIDKETLIFVKFLKSKNVILKKYPNAKVYTYGKGSLGLNLQNYNKIIFFDKTFDYAQRDQAEHRIFRVGQANDVLYYTLTGDVALEETIDKNISQKSNLLTRFKELTQKGDAINWGKII